MDINSDEFSAARRASAMTLEDAARAWTLRCYAHNSSIVDISHIGAVAINTIADSIDARFDALRADMVRGVPRLRFGRLRHRLYERDADGHRRRAGWGRGPVTDGVRLVIKHDRDGVRYVQPYLGTNKVTGRPMTDDAHTDNR